MEDKKTHSGTMDNGNQINNLVVHQYPVLWEHTGPTYLLTTSRSYGS